MQEPKCGVEKKNKNGKEYLWCKEHRPGKVQWVRHKPENHRKRTSTSPRSGGGTKPTGNGDSNKKLTLTENFKAEILAIKDQSNVQDFLY